MSILVLQHSEQGHAGALGRILNEHGHRLRVIELFADDALPADLDDVDGLVILGGPQNVDEASQHSWMAQELALIKAAHEAGRPIAGICLGAQLIAAALDGRVMPMEKPEAGWGKVKLTFPGTIDPLLAGITWTTMQFHMHGRQVTDLPPGAVPLAGSQACRNQAFKVAATTYAFQYHFEWTAEQIEYFGRTRSTLIERAGTSADAILAQNARHFDLYRHLGDRLCRNIAMLLMPTGKRSS